MARKLSLVVLLAFGFSSTGALGAKVDVAADATEETVKGKSPWTSCFSARAVQNINKVMCAPQTSLLNYMYTDIQTGRRTAASGMHHTMPRSTSSNFALAIIQFLEPTKTASPASTLLILLPHNLKLIAICIIAPTKASLSHWANSSKFVTWTQSWPPMPALLTIGP